MGDPELKPECTASSLSPCPGPRYVHVHVTGPRVATSSSSLDFKRHKEKCKISKSKIQ